MSTAATKKVVPMARYDAAQPSDYHPPPPPSEIPGQEWSHAGPLLRDWARHLAKNSSVIKGVLSSRQTDAIGEGLIYEPVVRDRDGQLIPEINDYLRRVHTDWADQVTVDGESSLRETEQLLWYLLDRDGEFFVRRVMRPEGYRVQVIPSDWVPAGYYSIDQAANADTVITNGIRRDQWGKPVTYYVDPYATQSTGAGIAAASQFVPVSAEDMTHFYRKQDAMQGRGITLLHAVILRVADLAEYMQSHRLAARASADLFLSINRSPDMDPATATERKWTFERLMILDDLLPGESANFHKPEHPNTNAREFIETELRQVAVGCDVGFSQIAQVFDRSYAAHRLERVDTWRKISRDRKPFIERFAKQVFWDQFIQIVYLTIGAPARALRRADPQTLFDCDIQGPPMPVIDPLDDRKALELDEQHGWDSRRGIIRKLGRNPTRVESEIAKENTVTDTEQQQTESDNDE